MGFNFPNSPLPGDIFLAPGGPQYVFSNGVWKVIQPGQSYVPTADTRNRIVNGAMQISQEIGLDVPTTNTNYPADQWKAANTSSGSAAFIAMSNAIAPNPKCIRVNSGNTIDAAVAATDYVMYAHAIEGIRVSDFLWGTANAKPAVLRFSARSFPGALTIGVSVRPASTGSHSFNKNFTLTAAWQDFVIPIPAQPNGVWPSDTSAALLLGFAGMAGTTYTTGAVDGAWTAGNFLAAPGISNMMATVQTGFDIANVGLYLDPDNTGVPPKWEEPDYAEELLACQRYWQQVVTYKAAPVIGAGSYYGTAQVLVTPRIPTPALSGVSLSNSSVFPATTGVLIHWSSARLVRETRVSTAGTASNEGIFTSLVDVNARM